MLSQVADSSRGLQLQPVRWLVELVSRPYPQHHLDGDAVDEFSSDSRSVTGLQRHRLL